MTYNQKLDKSQALSFSLQTEIDQQGILSFERFMAQALYHPEFGYYHAETLEIGRNGDFITAPEISPLFAQCIAQPILQIQLELPESSILELGAGTGQLACDLLQTLEKHQSLPPHYFIYEVSQSLRQKQQSLLKKNLPDYYPHIVWLTSLPSDFKGIIIANEVLDALPVRCFLIDDKKIKERGVKGKNSVFQWDVKTLIDDRFLKTVSTLQEKYHFSSGYISEIHLSLETFIQQLSTILSQGIILLIDYGYGEAEYYHPERNRGTLTAFYQHQLADPLQHPGLHDITAHVNFTAVIEKAADFGCQLAGYTTQAAFLLDCGLMTFAEQIEQSLSQQAAFRLHQAIKTLTLPTEMGERIKVMALSKQFEKPLIGFNFQDRKRDL